MQAVSKLRGLRRRFALSAEQVGRLQCMGVRQLRDALHVVGPDHCPPAKGRNALPHSELLERLAGLWLSAAPAEMEGVSEMEVASDGAVVEPLPPPPTTSVLGLRNGPMAWGSADDVPTLHQCLGTGS